MPEEEEKEDVSHSQIPSAESLDDRFAASSPLPCLAIHRLERLYASAGLIAAPAHSSLPLVTECSTYQQLAPAECQEHRVRTPIFRQSISCNRRRRHQKSCHLQTPGTLALNQVQLAHHRTGKALVCSPWLYPFHTLIRYMTIQHHDELHTLFRRAEFFEERAGILEFMAGYPRREAERLARLETDAWLKAKKDPEES